MALGTINVRFKTVHLDIPTLDYSDKISPMGVPAVFVFNRRNEWVKKLPLLTPAKDRVLEDVEYPAIKEVVAGLLRE